MKDFLKFSNFEYELLEEAGVEGGSSNATVIIDGIEVPVDINLPPVEETEEQKQARLAAEEAAKQSQIPPANNTGKTIKIDTGEGIKDFILDEEGNATLDGQIVYTKDQLELSNSEETTFDNIHTLISEVSGLELLDEEGKPIEFENGIEGLAKREIYIKDKFYKEGLNNATLDFFKNNPDIYDMYEYKRRHSSLEGYNKQVDYSSFEITDETSDVELESIIREYYSKRGNDKETIDRLIKLSKQDETLKIDALKHLQQLKELQKEDLRKAKELEVEEERKAIDKYETYYGVTYTKDGKLVDKNVQGSIYDKLVKQGKVGNIFIPQEGLIVSNEDGTKSRFNRLEVFNYFYKPVAEQNGVYLTQAQVDENNRLKNTDNFLIQGIRNITKGDISSLEKAMENVIKLKNANAMMKVVHSKPGSVTKLTDAELKEKINNGQAKVIIN